MAKEGSVPSFPGRTTVEPVALWLEMMIKDKSWSGWGGAGGKGGP